MGESYNYGHENRLSLPLNYIYAQIITPLWSHTIERIRYWLMDSRLPSIYKVSLQYLKPDGTPTGADLFSFERRSFTIDPTPPSTLHQEHTPPIYLVEGTKYAILIQTIFGIPGFTPFSRYDPPPGFYPRGKLIRSTNNGVTWDTTDRGDLYFAEYGDPPLSPSPHLPPADHWALTSMTQTPYLRNACTRVATASPCTLTCHVTDDKPTPISTYRTTRGVSTLCLDHYTVKNYRSYNQLEDCDSMYHTFYIAGLKQGRKYWFCFTGLGDFLTTYSTGPIFDRIHPQAPPFTNTRRPASAGDLCNIPYGFPYSCPDHYQNVNEVTPDGDASIVDERTPWTEWDTDLYNIPDLLPYDDAPIKQVHLTARMRYQGGFAYASRAKIALKTHGTIYQSVDFNPLLSAYKNYHWHLYLNPFTNLPWTRQEIKDLQIGVSLYSYWGVGWATATRCTQLYCKIIHLCEAYN